MRKLVLAFLFGFSAGAAAQDAAKPTAQDAAKPAAQDTAKPAAQDTAKPPAATQELDKDTQTRIRAERFAGGLGNITPEEKAAANVGAGPHRHSRPDGAAPREHPDSDSKGAGTGASR
jgi:hypothetical protein